MGELQDWQILILIMICGIIVVGFFRLVYGIGNYFYNKANWYYIKSRILKAKNKNIFNKWWD